MKQGRAPERINFREDINLLKQPQERHLAMFLTKEEVKTNTNDTKSKSGNMIKIFCKIHPLPRKWQKFNINLYKSSIHILS